MGAKLVGSALPTIPWAPRPAGHAGPVWRYPHNPVIQRDATPTSNSVFNSAVVPHGEGFAGVFRCDDQRREMRLHAGFSHDGVSWRIDPEPIEWDLPEGVDAPAYGYDPRVVPLEGRYYVVWCNGWHGPTIGLGVTDDTLLSFWYRHERGARIYDGAEEVHKDVVARYVLKGYGIDTRG